MKLSIMLVENTWTVGGEKVIAHLKNPTRVSGGIAGEAIGYIWGEKFLGYVPFPGNEVKGELPEEVILMGGKIYGVEK